MHKLVQYIGLGLVSATSTWAASTSSVQCKTLSWATNPLGQTPCEVGAALQGQCHDGNWALNPLDNHTVYSGPTSSDKCSCSTVTYSLVSACAVCQQQAIITWSAWSANCSSDDLSNGSYPLSIPSGTSVPTWASIKISGDLWNATAAFIIDQSNPSAVVGSSSGGKSAPAGAIAGGIVGGLAAIAIAAGIAWFIIRKRRREAAAAEPDTGIIRHTENYFPPEKVQGAPVEPPQPHNFHPHRPMMMEEDPLEIVPLGARAGPSSYRGPQLEEGGGSLGLFDNPEQEMRVPPSPTMTLPPAYSPGPYSAPLPSIPPVPSVTSSHSYTPVPTSPGTSHGGSYLSPQSPNMQHPVLSSASEYSDATEL